MPDGRCIEIHYQCDVKGYQPGGTDWRMGKGKPALDLSVDLWEAYKQLWRVWAKANPELMRELAKGASENDYYLSDVFASTPVSQARALSELLNEGL